MKAQCTTAAQCHRELARVMEQFGITDSLHAVKSRFIKCNKSGASWSEDYMPAFVDPELWSFAIAEVEGRPVFIGNKLWYEWNGTREFHVYGLDLSGTDFVDHEGVICFKRFCSWNPPKPKTVMVEMLREDAEFYSGYRNVAGVDRGERVAKACAKALKESE